MYISKFKTPIGFTPTTTTASDSVETSYYRELLIYFKIIEVGNVRVKWFKFPKRLLIYFKLLSGDTLPLLSSSHRQP